MYREDVPYLTFTPHRCLQTAWTRHCDQPELFYPDRLLKLRELAAEDPEITLGKLEDEAVKAKIRDEMNDAVVEKQKLQFIKGRHKGRVLRKASVTKAKSSKPRVSANANEDSPLYGFQVGLSKSSKINWIVKEVRRVLFVQSAFKLKCLGHSHKVLRYGEDEKFLIFSKSPLSLVHLSEALQVANIAFLEYTSSCDVELRRRNLNHFNSMSLYRVLLMELKYGARGL